MENIDAGDKVGVSMSQKINMGNYESKDFFASVTLTVRENETQDEAFTRAWTIVDTELESRIEEVLKEKEQALTEYG